MRDYIIGFVGGCVGMALAVNVALRVQMKRAILAAAVEEDKRRARREPVVAQFAQLLTGPTLSPDCPCPNCTERRRAAESKN